jgi:hypothetical protein
MAGSIGNGKAGTLREQFAHNQAERERAIAKIEGADWTEEDERTHPQVMFDAIKLGADLANETGKHRAQAPPSSAPQVAKGAAHVVGAVKTDRQVWALALLVVAFAVFVAWRILAGH